MLMNKCLSIAVLAICMACAPIQSIDTPNAVDDPEKTDYLLAHYTFDGTCADMSANAYDGVAIGAPSYTDDTPDGSVSALKINGFKGQFVNIPYSFMNGIKEYTISMWIKDFTSGILFSAISSDYVRSDYPRLLVTEDQRFRFYSGYDNYDTSIPYTYDCVPLMTGAWHHIAITVKGVKNNRDYVETSLYVDGVRVDSIEKYWSEGAANKMVLGSDRDGYYPVSMSATYDNVRFYACALNNAEIKNLYNNRK